jgi:hypothetical protein
MPERVRRDELADVSVYEAQDQLNRLAVLADRNPALAELRAQHALYPLEAIVAYGEALEVYGKPFPPDSRGARSRWPTVEDAAIASAPDRAIYDLEQSAIERLNLALDCARRPIDVRQANVRAEVLELGEQPLPGGAP